ncbi:MAG: histidine phosphatase family protein [Nocardioidaceae bacterium]|nr:histidine phosphatase family protein [Nocardioidaceae bacterium]MCL2614760.1 histidine phosphatase family protein [Nocardioidaceae bacterium]
MTKSEPTETRELWLARHGATEWSRDGRHTSTTDLPLLPEGEAAARALAPRLAGQVFAQVLTSPLERARRTAELAGFPGAEVDDDLVEWRYGDYEGLTTQQIRASAPGWSVFSAPCPGGETADQVADRLDRVVERARSTPGRTLVFAHGHCLRVLAARWLGLPPSDGRLFRLDTATLSVLGFERDTEVVQRWNS